MAIKNRDAKGRIAPGEHRSALLRFLDKCVHDPVTGCVNWIGGTTCGRGKTRKYGSFKYKGKRWYAHRWAAKFILGLDIDDLDVDHKCGNTLCQFHLQATTKDVNSAYYWIRVQVGIIDLPEPDAIDDDGIPFYLPPSWMPQAAQTADCPF